MDHARPTIPWWVRPAMALVILPAAAVFAATLALTIGNISTLQADSISIAVCCLGISALIPLLQILAWRGRSRQWSTLMQLTLLAYAGLSIIAVTGNALATNPTLIHLILLAMPITWCLIGISANRRWAQYRQTLRATRRHTCPACHYDLRQTPYPQGPTFPTCPECGHTPTSLLQ